MRKLREQGKENMKKVLTKKEFNAMTKNILNAAKNKLAAMEQDLPLVNGLADDLSTFDPQLGRLLSEADNAMIEPLKRLIKHISSCTEVVN